MATISILISHSHQERQDLINTAVPGDTVVFEEGDHLLQAAEFLVFLGDPTDTTAIVYTGLGTLRKIAAPGEHTEPCVKLRGGISGVGGTKAHRVTIDGLRFVVGGLSAKESGGTYKNIIIQNCQFSEIRTGIGPNAQGRCLDLVAGLETSTISNNRFENCLIQRGTSFGEAYAIYGLRFNDVTISLNVADGVQQFLFLNQSGIESAVPTDGVVYVTDNDIQHITRAGIEIQGNDGSSLVIGQDSEITGNVIQGWVGQANDTTAWPNSYGIILEARYSKSFQISGNTIVGPGVAGYDGKGVRAAIRVRGIDHDVYSNDLRDCSYGIAFAEGSGGYYWDNEICGSLISHAVVMGIHDGIVDGTIRGGAASANILRTLCSDSTDPYDVPLPNGEFDYVSDLVETWYDLQNAVGPIEVDQSVGTATPGDGDVIQIDFGRYAKGVGMAAPARLRIDLPPGKYSRFQSVVGVDDDVLPLGLNGGGVTFFVIADGVQLAASPKMRQGDPPFTIDVPVAERQTLSLEIIGEETEADYNHGSWGFARLVRTTDNPEPIAKVVHSWTHDVNLLSFTLRHTDGSSVTADL